MCRSTTASSPLRPKINSLFSRREVPENEKNYPEPSMFGEGEFPLVELLRATPRDIPWAIETPSLRRANAGVTALEQAREAMAALQGLLRAVGNPS